ncbi:uncharacterized protein [Amphiura filiformis]|uniref:uncharacterized protein n=1 Tax=Amphiura filiformis TaxID=82378 RepID=UPI003B217FEB
MADSSDSGVSKSQKKNLQRKTKKHPNETGDISVDPIADIREQLAEAKANKDHALANQLRQQLWIAQDLAAGYKPQIDAEDEKGQALLQSVQGKTPSQLSSPASTTTTVSTVSVEVIGNPAEEKKLKSLKKKLAQIEALKKRIEQGEKLEQNQLKKIETEGELKEEIEHLEKLLSIPMKR